MIMMRAWRPALHMTMSATPWRAPSKDSLDRGGALVAIGPALVGRQGEGKLAVVVACCRAQFEGFEPLATQFDVQPAAIRAIWRGSTWGRRGRPGTYQRKETAAHG